MKCFLAPIPFRRCPQPLPLEQHRTYVPFIYIRWFYCVCAIKHDLFLVSCVGNSAVGTQLSLSAVLTRDKHSVSIVAVDIYNIPSAITSTNQLPFISYLPPFHMKSEQKFSDVHHGTIQKRDHEISTDPGPQIAFSKALQNLK